MQAKSLWLCLILLASAVTGHAEGPFFALDGKIGFRAGDDVPDDALRQLKKVQASGNGPIKCIAFTPEGDWVILFGTNGFHSNNLKLPVCLKLKEIQPKVANFKCIAFTPAGGWVVLWDVNGSWTEGNVPEGAFNKLQETVKQKGELRSIAFGPEGSWVILVGKDGLWHSGLPKELAEVLEDAIQKQNLIRCVAFSGSDWICLADNGWWTSNPELPSAKLIAKNVKQGHPLKWISIKPDLPPHNFEKFAQIIRDELDGKVVGGYAYAVLNQGEIVAQGAEGWARAPWEREHPEVKWTLDKPMGIAGLSTTVTAVALLKLWEESRTKPHKFSLDEPFWQHIKGICPKASEDVKRVTIRHLLTHRSGLKKVDDCATPQDLEKLLKLPLADKRGGVPQYHNNNYYILRTVLEQISGEEYTPYVKEHVLKPMGITRMETHGEFEQPTCAYLKLGNARPGFPFDKSWDASAGAEGWYASADDLARFLTGIRQHKVLTPQTTQIMHKEKMGWDAADTGSVKSGQWIGDDGSGDASRAGQLGSVIAHFPDGIDAVLLVNCEPPTSLQDLLIKAWRENRAQ